MLGHVDHGKTSLTHGLTGVWTDTHSEELKRGITIKIGYADAIFRKCKKCNVYTSTEKCTKCNGKAEVLRKVSFLDAPGHETLMTTAIAASSIIDGAILVIGANEVCPQPQTLEHLMILNILDVKKVIIVQNKIDLVTREKAIENYKQIQNFVKGSPAENAPIIPIAANYKVNLGSLIQAIEETIPTPERNLDGNPKMYVARSFDVNKPGTEISSLNGGVLGGSLIQGRLKAGDEIEIRPGLRKEEKGREIHENIITKVEGVVAGNEKLEEGRPGGLLGIATVLDPALTKADGLVGNLIGKPGTLPEVVDSVVAEYKLLNRVDMENPPLKINEPLVVSMGTSTSIGYVEKVKKNQLFLKLKRSICIEPGSKIALSRKLGQRWRLAGFGKLL
ncbi:translation initiation factor IF-2 subunit gamma [Candidatus Micrarchaeota archaeon]|nr:translation initiation factor IF-2 subunit gamma [Candidatus Micrarchaeota archaeon]